MKKLKTLVVVAALGAVVVAVAKRLQGPAASPTWESPTNSADDLGTVPSEPVEHLEPTVPTPEEGRGTSDTGSAAPSGPAVETAEEQVPEPEATPVNEEPAVDAPVEDSPVADTDEAPAVLPDVTGDPDTDPMDEGLSYPPPTGDPVDLEGVENPAESTAEIPAVKPDPLTDPLPEDGEKA